MHPIVASIGISVFLGLLSLPRAYAAEAVTFTAHKVPAITVTVPADWAVLVMQPKLPNAMTAFQIPNPADRGTPDSTNVAVAGFAPGSKEGQATLARLKTQFPKKNPKTRSSGGWGIEEYSGRQGATDYTIYDATRKLPDRVLFVRLAWPHLPKNPSDYEVQMRRAFEQLLKTTK